MNILRGDSGAVKFRELAKLLRDRIESGEYKPGCLIPSEAGLQERFAVSRTTVRNAVGLLANEGYLKQQRGKGKGTFVLNRSLRMSRIRKGLSLGTLFSMRMLDSNISDIPAVMKGVADGLNLWEANLNLFPFVEEVDQLEYVKSIVSRNVIDGLFLWSMERHTGKVIDYLRSVDFPFVFLATDQATAPARKDICLLLFNEREPVDEFLNDMRYAGFQSVSLIGFEGAELDRTSALLQASRHASAFVFRKLGISGDMDIFQATVAALEGSLGLKRNLFVVGSNGLLPYFDSAVSHLRLKAPEDISVLFYKHYSPNLSAFEKKYSFIERRFVEFGRRASELMKELIARKEADLALKFGKPVVIKAVINHRGSVAAKWAKTKKR